jgi:hypothetical protein
VTEATLTQIMVAGCPYETVPERAGPAIVIECLQATANGEFSGPATTTVVRGLTLSRNSDTAWLQGRGWEAVVYLGGNYKSHGFGQQVLRSVQPTDKPC